MTHRKREIVVLSGIRTPLGKMGGSLAELSAVDLGVQAARELLLSSPLSCDAVDSVVIGNVIQPIEATNIARVIALKAGVPRSVPAHTVNRNCASGMQAVTDAAEKIQLGRADVVLAGGVESMTHAPLLFHDDFRKALACLQRAKSTPARLRAVLQLIQAPWKPRLSLLEGLTDPVVKMGMGQTAEVLAREFAIARSEQDQWSLQSHLRAAQAWQDGWYDDEVMHVFAGKDFVANHSDEGVRGGQSLTALTRLSPIFEKTMGTVTAGNSSQITDGAAMLLLSHRAKAESEGWPILGYIHDWSYSGCDPERMGMGPVHACQKVLSQAGLKMKDISRVEINEAFAVQILANLAAMDSKAFAQKSWGLQSAMGAPDVDKVNVHGGAIAMGHPVGMTGARIIFTMLRQLNTDVDGGLGLASLCVGGGQGGAVLLGSEPWQ
ncbi:MAG: thiolase family protein [Mariprofundaceae bacterium]